MEYHDLVLPHIIDVKLVRLNKPKFNYTGTPIFGEYLENYYNLDSSSNMSIQSTEVLLKQYNLTEILPSSNMMLLSNTFGKILLGEILDAEIFIINFSKTDDVKIREVKITITNSAVENFVSQYKKCEFVLFEASDIFIPAGKFFSSKISFNTDIICKYTMSTDIQYSCNSFNSEYLKNQSGKIIKTVNKGYYIEPNKGLVIRKYCKKMSFDNNVPFKFKDKLISNHLNKVFIEITLTNNTSFLLCISDYSLQINKNTLDLNNPDVKSNYDMFITTINPKKPILLDSDDEYNFIFSVMNHDLIQFIENFTFKLTWNNYFDSLGKNIIFNIKNKLVNDIVNISKYQVPNNDTVFLNEIFTVKFLVENISKCNILV